MKSIALFLLLSLLCLPAQEATLTTVVNSNRLEATVQEDSDRILLAKPKASTTPAQIKAVASKHKLKDRTKLKFVKWKQFELPPGQAKKTTRQQLLDSGLFEAVQENKVYTLQDTLPNDPFFSQLWGMTNIGAPKAWDISKEAPNMIVAVVDTGVDYNHPDLVANLWTGPGGEHGFTAQNGVVVAGGVDDYGHGTHVSGTIAGVGNNAIGVCGLAWRTKIMSIKVLHAGSGNTVDIVNGLEKLIELKQAGLPIVVSNHSYGGAGPDEFMQDGFRALDEADIVAAVAAGNANVDIDQFNAVPAGFPFNSLITVTANDSKDLRAYFSSFGIVNTDISAPGVGILSATRNNTYSSWNGTSMATPHVCGLALLLRARNPTLSGRAIRDLILDPASYDSVPALSLNNTSARINAAKSLSNPKLFQAPFVYNRPPVAQPLSPYAVISNKAEVFTFTASDPDGDKVRFGATASLFENDVAYFLKNLAAKNNLSIVSQSNATAISSSPFAWQLPSRFSVSASDNRGGGANAFSGFEIAKANSLRRAIAIKTWTVRTNATFGSITWKFDVEDPAKSDYSYIISWTKGWSLGSWFGATPSDAEVTASLGIDTSHFSIRVFVMDKFFNWANSDPIYFPADNPNRLRCVAKASVNEGNVPFQTIIDMSQSTGPIHSYYLFDLFGGSSSLNSRLQTNTFVLPEMRFFNATVLSSPSSTILERDSMVVPVFASRFASISVTNVPVPPTNPPPVLTNLVAVTDLSATLSGNSVLLRWTDKSSNEDLYSLEASHQKRGNPSPYKIIALLPGDSSSFVHLPTVRNNTWTYRVRACKGQICAPYSNLASARVN